MRNRKPGPLPVSFKLVLSSPHRRFHVMGLHEEVLGVVQEPAELEDTEEPWEVLLGPEGVVPLRSTWPSFEEAARHVRVELGDLEVHPEDQVTVQNETALAGLATFMGAARRHGLLPAEPELADGRRNVERQVEEGPGS